MTAATLSAGNRKADTEVRRQRSLEELVDRLIDALFKDEAEPSVTRSIHEARRLRQAGDIDAALTVLGSVDTGRATPREVRWASSEWRDLVKRRFGDREVMVYSQRKGRAAALIPTGADTLRGGRRAGDALAARQGCLGPQPAGTPASGQGSPWNQLGSRGVAAARHDPIAIPALRVGHRRASATRRGVGLRLLERMFRSAPCLRYPIPPRPSHSYCIGGNMP